MKTSTLLIVGLAVTLGTGVTPGTAAGAGGDEKSVVTVAFGMGLNTALPPPNGEPNHHILPDVIKVKAGGVVNFVVSGFHQIYVYQPGTRREDILIPTPTSPPTRATFFVNDPTTPNGTMFYYQGILPGGGPPVLNLAYLSNPRSNAQNRVEAVMFKEPGTYLVICNISPHLRDGMYAYVKVLADGDDN